MSTTIRNVNLHPSDHLPSSLKKSTYDVVLIGSGTPGRLFAARIAAKGLSIIIVEEELFGGDCPFWACIPSKALLRPVEALEAARQLGGAREMIAGGDKGLVDEKAVFARRDMFVQNWKDKFLVDLSVSQKCEVVRGRGVLVGEKKVKVTNGVSGDVVELVAKHAVVLATGSSPVVPDIPGLKDINPWTPREATASDFVPEHLVVLGGGVVACEMATFYSSFNKQVTLIQSNDTLLPSFEPEAGKRVQKSLEARGVTVLLSTRAESFQKTAVDTFEATLSNSSVVTGTVLLAATGRKANTADLGLDSVGISGNLEVDDSLRVKLLGDKWLYAIGDMNGRSPLTHMGIYQGRAAALSIIAKAEGKDPGERQPWDNFSATADHSAISQVVVTDPNVASAGLTLAEAKRRIGADKVKEVTAPFVYPGAWVHAEFNYDGWAQWVIDVEKEVLVGATFVGREAGHLLHASTVAIVGHVPISKLWHAVASFPTLSEIYTALLNQSGY